MADIPLRERKKQRTRDAVIEAALRLFAEKGFDATTVEEIAGAAEVAPRTFYRYFQTKEDVIFLDQNEENDAVRRALSERRPEESDIDVLLRATQAAITLSAQNMKHVPELYKLMSATPTLQGRTFEHTLRGEEFFVEGLLAQGARTREAELRARVLAACVTAIARVVSVGRQESGQRGNVTKDLEKAFEWLRGGFETAARHTHGHESQALRGKRKNGARASPRAASSRPK